ncbi:CDK-activating kinase assembly factor MAT1-like [Daphnia pulex]|uniref:CDK-activating kinase assembly factor MAT1 n=1 Tax=Daphnia pulex TaxID=6669 RepID=A0A4Y7MUH2_DAPPU|nr:CDK-activating kinase assembly factor MAT1-like [Daphnia pulex]SVE84463.1 EOG090X0BPM [Daphnia pulex]
MDGNDQTCPKCKTTKYRNPAMILMVNACGHALCESCVELLFAKGSGACPECKCALRRQNFRIQLFEDPAVDKEVDIRKRILKEFNKRQEDFSTLREYNDYLEEVENIIFNLVFDVDSTNTNKMIDNYKKENKDITMKNRNRQSQEEIELEELLEAEKAQQSEKANSYVNAELEEKKQKHKAREKLIDELMFSDADAKSIVASHVQATAALAKEQPKAAAQAGGPVVKSSKFSSGIQIGLRQNTSSFLPIPKQQDLPLFHYSAPVFDYNGPSPPAIEVLGKLKYFANIRAANATERAGGYTEALSCCRALQEAMGGLFYIPQSGHKTAVAASAEETDDMETA